MTNDAAQDPNYSHRLRLFVEEICCELCRFQHVVEDGLSPEAVQINREVSLDAPDVFADIRVQAPGIPSYFVEVTYGQPAEMLANRVSRKFGRRGQHFS